MAKTKTTPKGSKATKASKASCSKPKNKKASKKSASKKSAGGPRRSPKEIQDLLFGCVCEMHTAGVVDAPKILLAAQAGYSNPRSDGFKKAVKELMDQGLVKTGKDKEHFCLTQKGIDEMPDDCGAPVQNSDAQDRLLNLLKKKISNDKINALWAILLDGKTHTVENLATAIGYKNKRSPSFLDLIKALVELGLATKDGTVVVLTDIAFPCGRP